MNSSKTASFELWYRRIARISVGAVLFLILVGGIVRSSGSGMGCPDWPKCFGLLVPPTQVEEIPPAFFESHPQFETKSFNAFQTWTEYVNRLVGATIGLLMFITALLSLSFRKRDRRIVVLSVLAMFLTGFEGWLGKLVVDKNLAGGMVTIHMLGAILIVALLITANYLAGLGKADQAMQAETGSKTLSWLGLGVLLLTVAQILIGTQVRESVDLQAQLMGMEHRETWLQGSVYYTLHKAFWLIAAAGIVWWVQMLTKQLKHKMVKRLAYALVAFMVIEVALGGILAYLDLPPVAQPLHMLVANLIFAAEFGILVYTWRVERLFAPKLKESMAL